MTNQFLLQDHYVLSDAEGKMGVEMRAHPALDVFPSSMRLDIRTRRWFPDRRAASALLFILALRLQAFYIPVTAMLGVGVFMPLAYLLIDYVPKGPASMFVGTVGAVVALSWGVWVPYLALNRLPSSYIWLSSVGEERASVAELFAVKRIQEEIDGKKKQVEALTQQLSAARSVDGPRNPEELDDIATILGESSQKKKNAVRRQVGALLAEIRQLATRSQDLVRLAWACGILMEELKVAGLGGSYMELPHEDPLPFMERFIADGKAKLKAKYELDAMDEPPGAHELYVESTHDYEKPSPPPACPPPPMQYHVPAPKQYHAPRQHHSDGHRGPPGSGYNSGGFKGFGRNG